MILPDGDDLGSRCSRAGCQASAEFTINWRNPKIHGADRVKVWLACGEHRDYLFAFLEARDFPVAVAPLSVTAPRRTDTADTADTADNVRNSAAGVSE